MERPPMGPDPRADQELIDAANDGDADAFAVLYERYRDWVARLAFRLTGDEDNALDVLQDTFSYFLRKFPGFALRCQLKTFLYPVVKNLSRAANRRRRRYELTEADNLERMAAQADAAAQDNPVSESDALEQALERLPELYREVLHLRFMDDLSLKEIAQALEVPVGTVKSRLHHSLASMRRFL